MIYRERSMSLAFQTAMAGSGKRKGTVMKSSDLLPKAGT